MRGPFFLGCLSLLVTTTVANFLRRTSLHDTTGDSWVDMNVSFPNNSFVMLSFYDDRHGFLARTILDKQGVQFRETTDGGQSWKDISHVKKDLLPALCSMKTGHSPNAVAAFGYSGVWFYNHASGRFEASKTTKLHAFNCGVLNSMANTPDGFGCVGTIGSRVSGYGISKDGGETFQTIDISHVMDTTPISAAFPTTEDFYIAGIEQVGQGSQMMSTSQIVVSHDGGKTHTSVFTNPNYWIQSIDCSSPKDCCFVGKKVHGPGMKTGALFSCTFDGGHSWEETFCESRYEFYQIRWVGGGEYWITGQYNGTTKFAHSVDQGKSWSPYNGPGILSSSLSCVDPTHCWASVKYNFPSTDTGIAKLHKE